VPHAWQDRHNKLCVLAYMLAGQPCLEGGTSVRAGWQLHLTESGALQHQSVLGTLVCCGVPAVASGFGPSAFLCYICA